jgi:glycosyltransferase involved in cell wall biosynthesis
MTIAVWSPSLFKEDYSNFRQFIVETFFSFVSHHPDKKFFIVTDTVRQKSFPKNTEVVLVRPGPTNALLKQIWWDVKFPGILKKIKADLFISFENRCSLAASIPQSIVIQPTEKIKPAFIKKAQLVFVLNESMRNQLRKNLDVQDKKIKIIHPFASKRFKMADDKEKEHIKAAHSDGKEFFLYNSHFARKEDLIELLKSFSHFKKRQQSGFKLLLLTESNSFFEKSLSSYKYRGDVKFIEKKNDPVMITASAYAVILPFNTDEDMIAALNSMQSGIPVIATKNSTVSEMAGDAILSADKGVNDIGDKMMQLYKDENYRALLIEKGRSLAATFTQEKTTEGLWQSIMKALQ